MPDVLEPQGLVVVGASAGGVEALQRLVAGLPADLPAPVLVVLHVPSTSASALPAILDRAGPLPVRHARDGDVLEAGQVLVAPPDHHLVVQDGVVVLTRGPRENGHRPAVDVLFRTAARSWAQDCLAIVLSGALDDGAAGAVTVTQRGGICLVQDPDEALYDSMPRQAAAAVGLDAGVPVAEMPARIVEWLGERHPQPRTGPSSQLSQEAAMAALDPDAMHDDDRPGTPAGYGCPDCAGSLWRIDDGPLRRFRCRVGHAWSSASLVARQSVAVESALWMALRSLEEKAALNTELAAQAKAHDRPHAAARFTDSAQDALEAAELVRRLVAETGDAIDEAPPA
ncbi:MAG: chemotaxis protein CheB [Nocardioides sp.]|nr:chemotaxis protein CheB [Nocardioides sp.]